MITVVEFRSERDRGNFSKTRTKKLLKVDQSQIIRSYWFIFVQNTRQNFNFMLTLGAKLKFDWEFWQRND